MAEQFGFYKLTKANNLLLKLAHKMPTNRIGKIAALILRKPVLLSKQDVIDHEVLGIKMRFYPKTNVSERKFLLMPQFFDSKEREIIAKNLTPNGVFVDIGANAGIYSLFSAKLLKEHGTILAFEPNPTMINRLKANIGFNSFAQKIKLFEYGLSNKEEVLSLNLDPTNLGGSSIVEHQDSASKISVLCRPLLKVLSEEKINHIDILKIDVEGAEEMVLLPFLKDSHPTQHPQIIIAENSILNWEKDKFNELLSHNYHILTQTKMNIILEKD